MVTQNISSKVRLYEECTKSRASRAYVLYGLNCLTCLRTFVHLLRTCIHYFMCLACLEIFTCLLLAFSFLRALRVFSFYLPFVSSFFTCLTCLKSFRFFIFYVPYLPSFLCVCILLCIC